MNTLVLRLAAPMQSWGTQSRFSIRDTGRDPSKSGVIGLLCAALGRPRDQDLRDLNALTMAVRVDREGTLQRDYHTAGGGAILGKHYGVAKANAKKPDTVMSNRYYLADADFVVALEGQDGDLMAQLRKALLQPRWPIYLGRKSFVPARPVFIRLRRGVAAEQALRREPWLWRSQREQDVMLQDCRLRMITEVSPLEASQARCDVPLSFADRRFTLRHVKTTWIVLKPDLIRENELCSSHASS